MKIFPAIDLYDGKAVRLYKGDYNEMTVYSENPIEIAREFEALGAGFIHLVDLEGAKNLAFHRNRWRYTKYGNGGKIFFKRC